MKQIVPKAAFPHTASHTGKSLAREKLKITKRKQFVKISRKKFCHTGKSLVRGKFKKTAEKFCAELNKNNNEKPLWMIRRHDVLMREPEIEIRANF